MLPFFFFVSTVCASMIPIFCSIAVFVTFSNFFFAPFMVPHLPLRVGRQK